MKKRNLVAGVRFMLLLAAFAMLMVAIGCMSPPSGDIKYPSPTSDLPPFPYTTPLPPPAPTALDGVYIKFDPNPDTPTPCRRCADYRPEGGIWALTFDKGVFRIYHRETGWRSAGSYTVSGNRLTLFNDPPCIEDIGVYGWNLEKGSLTVQVVEDECSFRLRGQNLAAIVWASCQPPPQETGAGSRWSKPNSCP